jgi:hypothetical protein
MADDESPFDGLAGRRDYPRVALVLVALLAVVLATTFVGPVIGAALWLRGDGDASFAPRLGLVVFTGSLALAFAFGVYFHFVVWNPDHVHAVPADPWRLPFQTSAVVVAAANALATAVGVSCLARSR